MKTHLVQHTQISTLSFPPKLHSSSGCSARSMVSRIEGIWFWVPITKIRLVIEGILLAGERVNEHPMLVACKMDDMWKGNTFFIIFVSSWLTIVDSFGLIIHPHVSIYLPTYLLATKCLTCLPDVLHSNSCSYLPT
jgi:hypothetical protein